MRLGLLCGVLALLGACSSTSASKACQPACRSGYACVAGACVSACTPVCDATEQCIVAAGAATCVSKSVSDAAPSSDGSGAAESTMPPEPRVDGSISDGTPPLDTTETEPPPQDGPSEAASMEVAQETAAEPPGTCRPPALTDQVTIHLSNCQGEPPAQTSWSITWGAFLLGPAGTCTDHSHSDPASCYQWDYRTSCPDGDWYIVAHFDPSGNGFDMTTGYLHTTDAGITSCDLTVTSP